MDEQRREPRSLPIWVSLLVVLLCLGGGAWFVRWYFQTPIAKRIVGDAVTVENTPARENRRPRRPSAREAGDVRQLPDANNQKRWLVRAGWAQMRVNQPAGKEPAFSYIYSTHRILPEAQQETWVMFVRLRSDAKTGEFIKLTREQTQQLRNTPTSLDMAVSDADRKRLSDAWSKYASAAEKDKAQASEVVVNTLREVSRNSLDATRKALGERIARIRGMLTDEQVKAFQNMGR